MSKKSHKNKRVRSSKPGLPWIERWWTGVSFAAVVHVLVWFVPMSVKDKKPPREKVVRVTFRAVVPQKRVAKVVKKVVRPRPQKRVVRKKLRRRKLRRRKLRRRRRVRKIRRKKVIPVRRKVPPPRPVLRKVVPEPPAPKPPQRVAKAEPVVRQSPPPTPVRKVTPRPAPRPRAVDFGRYRQALYQSIVKKKQYPYMSRRLGQEGKVILLVEIHRNGTLKGAPRILRSSDYDLLNQEAIRMVKAAAPWPSMPSGYSQKSKRFRITIRFTLN